ncbi:MAG TPA: hypothetical protein VG267_12640 [Terracidiphilus sp.]|jgi:hypothetical protein|nr:hypothetical protein [Terracidiphilus sp.]
MVSTQSAKGIRIADGVWIATALLHREYPDRPDFAESEIMARFVAERLPRGEHSNSLPAHIHSHCVANHPRSRKRTDPGKLQGGAYRILYESRSGFRRLFRPGDDVHPDRVQPRRQSKTIPRREEIPAAYHDLLNWYEIWTKSGNYPAPIANLDDDPLLRLRGSGRHIWADEHADEYVERLRRETE